MRWDIAPKIRCDIFAFSGINFSGTRKHVQIFPVGGQQGDSLDGFDIQSIAIAGPQGTRVTLMTTGVETGWEEKPWRCFRITKEKSYKSEGGLPAVRAPDLDTLDAFNARRSDPDFEASPDAAENIDAGTSWTFGRFSGDPIKGNVRAIKIDWVKP